MIRRAWVAWLMLLVRIGEVLLERFPWLRPPAARLVAVLERVRLMA